MGNSATKTNKADDAILDKIKSGMVVGETHDIPEFSNPKLYLKLLREQKEDIYCAYASLVYIQKHVVMYVDSCDPDLLMQHKVELIDRVFMLAMKHFAGEENRKRYIGYERKDHSDLVTTKMLYAIAIMLGQHKEYEKATSLCDILIAFGDSDFNYIAGMYQKRINEDYEEKKDKKRFIDYMYHVPHNSEHFANAQYELALDMYSRVNDAKEYTENVKMFYDMCKRLLSSAKNYCTTVKDIDYCDDILWRLEKCYQKLNPPIATS